MTSRVSKRKTNIVGEDDKKSPIKKSKKLDQSLTVTSKYFDSTKSTDNELKDKAAVKCKGRKTAAKASADGKVSESNLKTDVPNEAESKPKTSVASEPAAVTDRVGKGDNKMDSPVKGDADGRLDFQFYDQSCEDLAKALLGQTVVTTFGGKKLAGKIVETEAYLGAIDKAAHSYKGKTDRNAAMFMKPGTAYVYNIYGMYCCLNISAQGDGCAVLIRSLQPVENLEVMDKLRTKGKEGTSLLKKEGKDLCNGPSKLCQALNIKKDPINKQDLCTSNLIWLEKGDEIDNSKIVISKRINIDYAEEWIDKPLRFYVLGNNFVSVRDKNAENVMK